MTGKSQEMNKVAIVSKKEPPHTLLEYCPDLDGWAKSWSYEESDLAPGHLIVAFFKPFLLHLLAQGLATRTLRRHRDHLWTLGGEVIRCRQEEPQLCRLPVEKVTYSLLEEDGGPLIWPRITEQEQDSFDATCRKFYSFLTAATDDNQLLHKSKKNQLK